MPTDGELLRSYVEEGSQDAFATLVQRHLNLVYRAALRRVGGDAHSAHDVVQKVFVDLARKARSLSDRPNLAGWLYTGTRFAAGEIVRGERRRRAQEQEAQNMHELENRAEIPGERLDPVLDEVMDLLNERDRDAVLLHFFEGLTFQAVGETLSVSADAARMRVNRSLERLRSELARRGVASTAIALATVLSTQSGYSVPSAMAGSVVRQVLLNAGAAPVTAATWLERLLRMAKSSPGMSSVAVAVTTVAVVAFVMPSKSITPTAVPAGVTALTTVQPTLPTATQSATNAEVQMESLPVEAMTTPPAAGSSPRAVSSGAASTGRVAERFADLLPEEKLLLKQLWAIHLFYGETPGRVFSFTLGPAHPRYAEFALGRDLLESRGWVKVGLGGRAILNPLGRAFGDAHAYEINAFPNLFKQPDGSATIRPKTDFGNLSAAEKMILKKLWTIEIEGKNSGGRSVGLNVAPGAPGYENFKTGRDSLLAKGWVSVGAQ
ncbi:MAG: sigma-70 family RNA polymerase sigma factor, partial [Opitutaceae bacterium]